MRRIAKILLVLFLVFFVALMLYAWVKPARAWMDITIGPFAIGIFGGIATAITSNPIWKNWVVPFPNQLILGALILGFPIAFLWHKSFNRVRRVFVKSAAKDSGMYPTMTEPVSTPAPAPQPTPTAKTPEIPTATQVEAQIDKELEAKK